MAQYFVCHLEQKEKTIRWGTPESGVGQPEIGPNSILILD